MVTDVQRQKVKNCDQSDIDRFYPPNESQKQWLELNWNQFTCFENPDTFSLKSKPPMELSGRTLIIDVAACDGDGCEPIEVVD